MLITNLNKCFALPCNVYLKDREGLLLECSPYQAQAIGKEKDTLIGENSYHFLPKLYEDMIKKNDERVVICNKPLFFIEHVFTPHGSHNYISYKLPIMTSQAKIDIFGASIMLNEKNFSIAERMTKNFSKGNFRELVLAEQQKYTSDGRFPPLSHYEIDYLYHLLCGDKSEKISHNLALSRRTIEYYLAKMKDKFCSETSYELLMKILLRFLRQ